MLQTDLDPANDINTTSADLDSFDTIPISSTEDETETEHLESLGIWQEDTTSTDHTFEMENDPGESNCCDRYGHQFFFNGTNANYR